jgi:hypothetical protein
VNYVGSTSANGHPIAVEVRVPSAGGITRSGSRLEKLPDGRVSTDEALGSIAQSGHRPARIAW